MTCWTAAVALVLAAGCVPPHASRGRDEPAAPAARLVVYRLDSPYNRSPREPLAVHLDARPLAALSRSQFVSVEVAEGTHLLAVPGRSVSLELAAGEPTYCRLSAMSGSAVLAWEIGCGSARDAGRDLDSCTPGVLDPTVDWRK
ncbi:MAG TPA: hypothetical protein VMR31_01590 [Myxococcota bacterium]|nr:hypothetical protein [Myxococcota bacterium]